VTVVLAGGGERRLVRSGKERIADGVLDEVEILLAETKESHDRAIRADAARAAGV